MQAASSRAKTRLTCRSIYESRVDNQSKNRKSFRLEHTAGAPWPGRRGDRMRRRDFIALFGGTAATWPLAAYAQQVPKILQIGVLSGGRGDRTDASLTTLDAFIPALRELGFIEGQSVAFDRKFADGDANRLNLL